MNKRQITVKLKEIVEKADNTILVGLTGEPGAGKTDLVRSVLNALQTPETETYVVSPTFTYRQVYKVIGKTVSHFDLYRVQDDFHLENIGFWDALGAEQEIIFCEWPELFGDVMPQLDYLVGIRVTGQKRHYELSEKKPAVPGQSDT